MLFKVTDNTKNIRFCSLCLPGQYLNSSLEKLDLLSLINKVKIFDSKINYYSLNNYNYGAIIIECYTDINKRKFIGKLTEIPSNYRLKQISEYNNSLRKVRNSTSNIVYKYDITNSNNNSVYTYNGTTSANYPGYYTNTTSTTGYIPGNIFYINYGYGTGNR